MPHLLSLPSLLSLLALALLAANAQAADEWPQFRGPGGQGHADAETLPLHWGEDQNIAWKTPVPGRGWSSPVVTGNRIWLTTAEEFDATPEEREKLLKQVASLPVAKDMVAFESISLVALEFDLATGEPLRRVELFRVPTPPPIHGLNTYASPTPVLAGGRCFCHFGAYGTACIDLANSEVLWRRTLPLDHIVGPGSSPAVVDGVLIVPCDGGDKQYVEGLDPATGKTIWHAERPPIRATGGDFRKAFSTPLAIEAAGRRQVVIPGAQWFVAYDPTSGDELWRVDHGKGFSNVPRPVFDGRSLYLITGFGKPQLWSVRPDGTADVTDTHVGWRFAQQVPAMSSPVVADGLLWMISDGGVATCLNAESGSPVWRERIPGKYSASPLHGAGRVYFSNHEGRTTVIDAGPEYKVLAENDLDGMLLASPAAVEGTLILRTDGHLYRIRSER